MLLALFAIVYCVNGELVGPITIKENGQNVQRYVVSTYSPLANVSGSSVMLQHDSQVQIVMNASATYTPYMFVEYKLKGKTISFTADLSAIGCSCNAAFYLVTMPGYGSNGKPYTGGSGDYYCDANDDKDWCWEMDIMEANKYVIASTPHTCSSPPGAYITSCDRGGCGTNSYRVDSKGMCPDSSCKINTMQPFRQSISFGSTMHVTLTQNGNQFSYDVCGKNSYIQEMDQALNYGMNIVLSYWGSTYSGMQWLDGMTGCTGDCAGTGQLIFSDIEIS